VRPVRRPDRRTRALAQRLVLKLGELWGAALALNLVGGRVLALIVTSDGVVSGRSHAELVRLELHRNVITCMHACK
jgi:hypothetical protein